MSSKRKALGRGLESLLGDLPEELTSYVSAVPDIPIDAIEANPWQPRTDFEEEALIELANSIKAQGIIQPITVRKIEQNKYQLISGERRIRAARFAGLISVPAYVRQVDDIALLEMALVENIQRQDLNPIEIALSFKRLIEECNLTQEQLSNKVAKNRSTISNYLRLLKLPAEIQVALRDNVISMGHARAIINIEDQNLQMDVFKRIVENSLSVRQVEKMVQALTLSQSKKVLSINDQTYLPENIKQWQQDFSQKHKTKVRIVFAKNGRGSLTIVFNNLDHMQKIINSFRT